MPTTTCQLLLVLPILLGALGWRQAAVAATPPLPRPEEFVSLFLFLLKFCRYLSIISTCFIQ